MPPQLPEPPARPGHWVQVLRTYPYRRPAYPFAPRGERSIARAYAKALARVRSLIYVEDQYLWSAEIAELFGRALARRPELRMIGVVPMHPDQGGPLGAAQSYGRRRAIQTLHRAGGDRVAVYGLENHDGWPIYVHAKVCVMDDVWTSVGSDNINLRSWTHDSELALAIVDDEPSYSKLARETTPSYSKLARETTPSVSKLARETTPSVSKLARETTPSVPSQF